MCFAFSGRDEESTVAALAGVVEALAHEGLADMGIELPLELSTAARQMDFGSLAIADGGGAGDLFQDWDLFGRDGHEEEDAWTGKMRGVLCAGMSAECVEGVVQGSEQVGRHVGLVPVAHPDDRRAATLGAGAIR